MTVLAEFFCKSTVCLFTTFSDLLLFSVLFLHVVKSVNFVADKV